MFWVLEENLRPLRVNVYLSQLYSFPKAQSPTPVAGRGLGAYGRKGMGVQTGDEEEDKEGARKVERGKEC